MSLEWLLGHGVTVNARVRAAEDGGSPRTPHRILTCAVAGVVVVVGDTSISVSVREECACVSACVCGGGGGEGGVKAKGKGNFMACGGGDGSRCRDYSHLRINVIMAAQMLIRYPGESPHLISHHTNH